MTHGLDTSVALRILSGLPEEEAAAVADRLLEDIQNGDEFEVSYLQAIEFKKQDFVMSSAVKENR